MGTGHEIPRLLVLEDNANDIRLFQEALRRIGLKVELHVVNDGVEAMDFLKQREKFAKAPRPNLVILDLGTPRKGGLEVVSEIKTDPALRSIPVIVFSQSKAESDIQQSYDHHANCYIVKPLEFVGFRRSIEAMFELFLNTASLPMDDVR